MYGSDLRYIHGIVLNTITIVVESECLLQNKWSRCYELSEHHLLYVIVLSYKNLLLPIIIFPIL